MKINDIENNQRHHMNQKNHSSDNIPELRFPEFKDAGEWKAGVLGGNGISFFVKERTPLEKLKLETYISTENLLPDYAGVTTSSKLPPAGSFTRFQKGDILISNIRPYLKKVWSANMDGAASNDVIVIRADSIVSESFLSFLLKNDDFISFVMKGAKGVKMPRGDKSLMEEYPITFPKPKEQQKIASCLSSLDEVITAHNQKLEALKVHKKGLMQNLFPAASTGSATGKNVPNYRFPEFLKDGEWVEKTLGDKEVSFFVNEKISINKLNIDSYISTENMLPEFSGVSMASKLPPSGSFTKFKNGDILISNIRPYLKKVWKSDIIGGASNDVLVFRSGSEVLSEFLEFIIKNEAFINYVMESAKGVKMPRGDKDSMQKYTVFIPSKAEQQKIASCLSSLDALITSQAEKIEQLKIHKKGLMQGLFPSITN